MSGRDPTGALKAGRRALDGVPGVRILRDLCWHESHGVWALHLRISIECSGRSSDVPAVTDWYVHIDPYYPYGPINVLPAKANGLHGIFPHQADKRDLKDDSPWNWNDLCLVTPYRLPFGRFALGPEPRDAALRLAWYVRRAKEWVHAAADGTLLRRGDPYELPVWKRSKDPRAVVYAESASNFDEWNGSGVRFGLAELAVVSERYLAVLRWCTPGGRVVAETSWGDVVTAQTQRLPACWLLLRHPPVLRPWQAPRTWGELLTTAKKRGGEIEGPFRQVLSCMSDAAENILLVGFGIPAKIDERPSERCWKAIVMPRLETTGKRGFRRHRDRQWAKSRLRALGDDREIHWLGTENWHADRIGARGRLGESLRLSRIAILGLGAVGSFLAESLVRGGARDLLLVDADELAMGNLVRHRLKMDSLEQKKAPAMLEELSLISPHVKLRAVGRNLPLDRTEARALLEDRDIVIDCTGDNTPLEILSDVRWDSSKLFVSISVGYGARRLYFFSSKGDRFPFESFIEQAERWLPSDRAAAAADPLRFEGAGCWHPVWPGCFDDLMLLSATASKLLEAEAGSTAPLPGLQVFERWAEPNNTFAGVRRVHEPPEACAA